MDSMPPATTIVALPVESSSKAIIAAFMPEPHILFTVVAGVVLSRPAPERRLARRRLALARLQHAAEDQVVDLGGLHARLLDGRLDGDRPQLARR